MSAALARRRRFEIHVNAAARTISPRGEVDVATAPNLLAAAQTYLTTTPGDLIIDLAAVTFGDSSLVNAVADIQAGAREHDDAVTVINASARLARLFLLCGMTEMLDRANLSKN
jgi:anti-anti-sigma factor